MFPLGGGGVSGWGRWGKTGRVMGRKSARQEQRNDTTISVQHYILHELKL